MSSILILGSEGFIGTHLVNYFIGNNEEVYGCDLFETSKLIGDRYFKVSALSPEWEDIFLKQQYDVCINAAGSASVPYSMAHPMSDFLSNSLDMMRVLDAIRRLNPNCRFLQISSAAVYGNPQRLPIPENSLCSPISPYGYHKLISETICKEYQQIFGIHIAVVRPFSVYGEGQQKQLLWDICMKAKNTSEIKLFGTGLESRDFIHVADLAKLLQHIIDSGNFSCDIFNAASGNETTIKEIADCFVEYYEGKKKVIFSGEVRHGDPINWCADISAAKAIGYAPSIGIKDGIYRFIKWFENK